MEFLIAAFLGGAAVVTVAIVAAKSRPRRMTERQARFIAKLIDERDAGGSWEHAIVGAGISAAPNELTLDQASSVIEWLLDQPRL